MKVLVADDDATTRTLLAAAMRSWGYEVIPASNGAEAWAALQNDPPPEVAILDWVMPSPDGVDVCRRLKEQESTPFVYTIIVTGKHDRRDLVAGLEAGADDFLTKPFERDELRSRIKAGARIVTYERALAQKNAELQAYAQRMESLAEERARQLVHADRMATLGAMAAGIAHEINNPAAYISSNVAILEDFWPILASALRQTSESGRGDPARIAFVRGETLRVIEGIRDGVNRIARIVSGMRTYAHRGETPWDTCSVNTCVEAALELCHNSLKHQVRVEKSLAPSLPNIQGAAQEIEQVFVNIILNANEAMTSQNTSHAPSGNLLRIATKRENANIEIRFEDTGPGIPGKHLDLIWTPFFTTKEAGKGTGLGLAICWGIIQRHGGLIHAENRPQGGACFVIQLPLPPGSA